MQNEQQDNPRKRLIKLPEVLELTSLSRTSVYRMMKAGEFPKSLKLSKRSRAWLEGDVKQWIDERELSA